VEQAATGALRKVFARDPEILSWALSDVEMMSALSRLEREEAVSPEGFRDACASVELLWEGVTVVSLVEGVKVRARRVLRMHPLRAADACQLGAALLAVYDDPGGWEFVCLDERLRQAALREGFALLP